MRSALLLRFIPVFMLGGCDGVSSALDPAGVQAGHIASGIWWPMFWVTLAVYAAVLGWLGYALLHRRRREPVGPALPLDSTREQRAFRWLAAWVIGTVLILMALTAASYSTDARLVGLDRQGELGIEVTGNQWWWQVRYLDADPSRSFITANEIHVPVGTPVKLTLRSNDVIHSFWAPSLHGKQDLIPGRDNDLDFRVDREGVYRGQCAEFCGLQHAHMAFEVVAQPQADFEAWRAEQVRSAAEPADDEQRQGRDVFLSSACVMCHSVRGTRAAGRTAPDLTHLASRRTIAAGALPYSRGNLAAWIVDPQRIKPGNHMPMVTLSPDELQALLAYLDSLK